MFNESDLRSIIEPELENDEKLVWTARPGFKRMMIPAVLTFGMGIVWTAFIANFIYLWHSGPNDVQGPGGLFGMQGILSDLFFVPFILIGVAGLFSPIWFYINAKRTVYGVTDKRILIIRNGRSRRVKSYGPADIGEVERTERADRSGDLAFARRSYRDSDGHQRSQATQFVGIPEVRCVETFIRDLLPKRPDPS